MFNITRPPEHMPDRLGLNWLLASCALVVALHAAHLPSWLSLAAGCLIMWRYIAAKLAWRTPGRWLRLLLTGVLAFVVLKHFGTIFGRDPGVALLIVLLAMKLFELERLRDFSFVVFLLYFLCLGAFLYSQSLWVGAYALGIAAITTISLIRISQPTELPLGFACRLGLSLLLKAVPLMLVMYFLFPRIQGTLWGLPGDAYDAVTGLSDTVQPGTINQLLGSDAVAFRVEFEGEPPPNRDLYWRVFVLADTDGNTWKRSSRALSIAAALRYEPRSNSISYTITLEPHHRSWLVSLDLPASLPANTRPQPGFVLAHRGPVHARMRYQLRSHTRYNTGEITAAERREALRLAASTGPRLRQLVSGWQAQYTEPADIVDAALAHFNREGFIYTLTPPLLGDDPIDEFLFETREGYCEHYASAFVTLMRAAGIPSRMVVGYQGGESNAVGDYMIVRQSDAHAWAEVWLAGRGWVRVDPTAAVAPERIEFGLDALLRLVAGGSAIGVLPADAILSFIERDWIEARWRGLMLGWDAVNNAWNRWVLDYGPERQRKLLERLGFDTPSWTQMAATLATAVGLLLFLVAALVLHQARPEPAVAYYHRFCRKLWRAGLRRNAHEGPLDFAHRACHRLPRLAAEIRTITNLYVKLRYTDRAGGATVSALRNRVRRFRIANA